MPELIRPEIEAYAEAHSIPESAVCRMLRAETMKTMEFPHMMVGPLEGAFLKMMVQLTGATRVLEIGMFTGYSTLCFAEALPEGGTVMTCEVDDRSAAVARRYFAQSPDGYKITVKMGPALETMRDLTGPFDLIFIDADKQNYVNYYQRSLGLLTSGGVILIDNVLWDGDVLRDPPPDVRTAAIRELNRLVSADQGVTAVMLTIRDGILVVRPKRSR